MPVALAYAARSDIGLTRSNNQDSGYAGPHLLMVADGMGGHAGGDIASSVAVAHLALLDEEAPSAEAAAEAINQTVTDAHAELLERVADQPELAGLGTTITALLRCGDRLVLAHIGDSRAYLLRDGQLEQVTTDHTFVQYLVETGKLEPEQAERHPQRSLLLRVLGDVELSGGVDISARPIKPGDRWLVCSDGLSSVVSAPTLSTVLSQSGGLDEIAERLIDLALRAGGPDNITCVVADVLDLDSLPDGQAPTTSAQVVGAAAIDRDRPTRGGSGAAGKAAQLAAQPSVDQGDALTDGSEAELTLPAGRSGGRAVTRAKLRLRRQTGQDRAEPAGKIVTPRRGRRLLLTGLAVVLLFGITFGLSTAYHWSQTQYYIGQIDGRVAIFQGINQRFGPVELSHPVQLTSTITVALPEYAQDRLRQTIPAASRAEADQKLADFLTEVKLLERQPGSSPPVEGTG